MEPRYTLCVFSENSPGVLQRITVLFTRRKLNIESLTVSETERKGVSRFTIVVRAQKDLVEKVSKQVARIIEVSDVYVCEDSELVFRETAFYRVTAHSGEHATKLSKVLSSHGARVSFEAKDSLVISHEGSEEEVQSLLQDLRGFGVREFVRSGRIAVLNEPREMKEYQQGAAAQPDEVVAQSVI